jgi:hypothetical protein
MYGRLPKTILASHKTGTAASDWFPRMTRARADLRAAIDRLSRSRDVASIIDTGLLKNTIDAWPDSEPLQNSAQAFLMSFHLPQAIGTAMFIQSVTGSNLGD